jgi:ubiquinone/menaquinone biosynthesis C-methylase UbiE
MTTRPPASEGPGAAPRFRCPDCGKAMGALEGAPVCAGCGRVFSPERSVWDLLPPGLDAVKVNEDLVHADVGLPTWRRLLSHKRHWIEWAETRFLPAVLTASTRRFLEIGGGLCYASALAKSRAPQAFVVATDVSARYLRNHAVRAGEIIGTPADAYAAVDAEELPFEDGEFDAVYSQVVLYRLPDPTRALREIRRVLAPGGRYLGVERASPWAWSAREADEMGRRAAAQGTGERPRRYREWETLLTAAGLPPGCLSPLAGRRVRSPRLRRLGNAVRPIYVAIRIDG